MSTRQDMIDASWFYLSQAMPVEELDQLPIESWRAQEHREAIAWALNGGARPALLERKRTFGSKRDRPGRRTGELDPSLVALVGDRERPPVVPGTLEQLAAEAERARLAEERRIAAGGRPRGPENVNPSTGRS